MSRAGLARALLLTISIAAGLLSEPGELSAHPVLRGAVPAADARLTAPPGEIRLTFSEGVVIAFTHIRLLGAGDTAYAIGLLSHPGDSATVVTAAIEASLPPGDYTVVWEAAGSDGHPTVGRFAFTIAPLPPLTTDSQPGNDTGLTPSEHHDPQVFPERGEFGVNSAAFVLLRWVTFLGLLGVIGAITFLELVIPQAFRDPSHDESLRNHASVSATRIGLGAAALLGVMAVMRLGAQAYALEALDVGMIFPLLFGTIWGWGWTLQLVATVVAAIGLARYRGVRRSMAAVAIVALAVSAALSGHPAAMAGLTPVTVVADSLHVLGAGGWIGTLLLVLVVGLPTGSRLPSPDRTRVLAALVNAFSRVALVAAGLVVATGAFAAWLHLGSVTQLWQSTYGQTLLLKIAVVSVVFAIGAYNQRRVRPAITAGGDGAAGRLQRSATIELAFGALVLLITAVLVATSPPGPA